MNRYISLDNIFNYIPNSIRSIENDDDQLKSWAMQGFRLFNQENLRYVEDFQFIEVKNHQANIPIEVKSIISAEWLVEDILLQIEDYIEEHPEFDVTYFNTNTDRYKNLFKHLDRVDSKAYDYYCNIQDCRYIYSITDSLLQTPVNATGCIALKYWTEYKKGQEVVLKEKPEVLWHFLAKFAEAKHWENRAGYKEQGAQQMATQRLIEAHNLFASSKSEIIMSNAKIKNLKHNMYGESQIVKIYPYLTQLYRNVGY